MDQKLFLGIDVSTTAAKSIAMNPAGETVAESSVSLPSFEKPHKGWAEQSPEDWFSALSESLRSLSQKINPSHVAGVGLTGQMLGLVSLGSDNTPLRPAILWNDQRSEAECEELTAEIGPEKLAQVCGSKLLPGMVLPKLRWLKRHEPEVWERTRSILLPKDYLAFRLTGEKATDVTDASGVGLLDIEQRTWSADLVAHSSVPDSWLPRVLESHEIVGKLTQEAAEMTSLPPGIPVTIGAGDQPAQAYGAGLRSAGESVLTVGTSGVYFQVLDAYTPDEEGRLHTFCYAAPDQWCAMGVMLSAAGSFQWLRDELFPEKTFAELDAAAAAVPPLSEGLLFAPYLSGERHPHTDAQVRGGFIGIDRRHGMGHFARAVMEGVSYGLRELIELLKEQGSAPESIALSGGGAVKSPVWQQILADVIGLPLVVASRSEGAALGAAMLAAKSHGHEIRNQISYVESQLETDARSQQAYEDGFARWVELYPVLREISRK